MQTLECPPNYALASYDPADTTTAPTDVDPAVDIVCP